MDVSQVSSRTLSSLSCLFLLALGASVLILNGRWVLAEGYTELAREGLRAQRINGTVRESARMAQTLSPFPATQLSLYARTHTAASKVEALQEFRRALAYAPADAFLWQSFVRFKLRMDQHDPELEYGVDRVHDLAPHSLAFHRSGAELALHYWYWAGPGVRARWVESLRFALHHDPHSFLAGVLTSRRERILCREPRFQTQETREWCPTALQAREFCYGGAMKSAQLLDWCSSVGLGLDPLR